MRTLVAVLLLFAATAAHAQTPFSSLLFTSSNLTANEAGPTDYAVCQSDPLNTPLGDLTPQEQLSNVTVNAVWFNGSSAAPVTNFSVQDCTTFVLVDGRTVDVFSSSGTQPTSADCQVNWYVSPQYVTVVVNLTAAYSYWSISLPRAANSVTRATCFGTRSECLLSSASPCTNVNLLGDALPSFLDSTGSCAVGEPSPDSLKNKTLLYGLQAEFFPRAFPNCSAEGPFVVPNFTVAKPEIDLDRCQSAPNYLAPNSTFPSIPPLPSSNFTNCYGVQLKGYVNIENNTDLIFATQQPVPSFYNSYRVCLRFSNLVRLTLNGKKLIESTSGDYDAALTCLDIPYLPQGLIPFQIDYAVPPGGTDRVILQFYVIPVGQVANDFRPGGKYLVTYDCDCCSLFSTSGTCCKSTPTCNYRTPTCGVPQAPPPAPVPAPAFPPTLPPVEVPGPQIVVPDQPDEPPSPSEEPPSNGPTPSGTPPTTGPTPSGTPPTGTPPSGSPPSKGPTPSGTPPTKGPTPGTSPPSRGPTPSGTPPTNGPTPSGTPPTKGPTPSGTPPTKGPTPSGTPPTKGPTPSGTPPTTGPTPSGTPPTKGPTPSGTPPSKGPTPSGTPPTNGPTPGTSPPTNGPTPSGTPPTKGPTPSGTPPTKGPTPSGTPPTKGPTPSGTPPSKGPTPSGTPPSKGPDSGTPPSSGPPGSSPPSKGPTPGSSPPSGVPPGSSPPSGVPPGASPPATPPAPPPKPCTCITDIPQENTTNVTRARRNLGEGDFANPNGQKTRDDVSFAQFKDLVSTAVSWDNLEAMLA